MMVTVEEILSGSAKIAIVGLGYVGLPLAVAFGRIAEVIGFDISKKRIGELQRRIDSTGEISSGEFATTHIDYTTDAARLAEASFIIVAVPTPIDEHRNPDLRPVAAASRSIGKHLSKGSIVVYESTVYPGATEEVCVPLLEEESGFRCGVDFKIGYSPERINPGDKIHVVEKVVKVVSGMDAETLDTVANVYALVVTAGVHRAPTIKTAEASKIIENTQRDINIALMNELAVICEKLGIETRSVLDAASTKWNFMPFKPGLVGGHCIGVDPYYLTFKAEAVGYHPQVILAGRRINDSMGKNIAAHTVKLMIREGKTVQGSRVLVLGLSFKENVRDIRNSKVVDIVEELKEFGVEVLIHDPLVEPEEALREYGLPLAPWDAVPGVDAVILAVPHDCFNELSPSWYRERTVGGSGGRGIVVDVKSSLSRRALEDEGLLYWSL